MLGAMTSATFHSRHSIRLPGYDYTQAGAYFVTICARERECLFGEVADGKMRMNKYGEIIQRTWNDLPNHYQGVELGAFIIMPNHVHGIVSIVGAIHESPLHVTHQQSPERRNKTSDILQRRRMLLSRIVGRFKMVSAKRINEQREMTGVPLWQRNYYEHIVRDEESLARIKEYISNNPNQWDLDRENPMAISPEPENAWKL